MHPCCRYLELSNSGFGAQAHTDLQALLNKPSLQLCILKAPLDKPVSIAEGSAKVGKRSPWGMLRSSIHQTGIRWPGTPCGLTSKEDLVWWKLPDHVR